MKRTNLYALAGAVGILILAGVGCSSGPTNQPVVPTTPPTTSKIKLSQPAVTPTSPTTRTETTAVTLPTIDDTWKTYANNALGFSFQWPTKGRYAPTWDVTFVKEEETDCIPVTLNGIVFCHASASETAADKTILSDRYTTQKDNQYVLVSFEKTYLTANAQFDVAAYHQFLDQIMSTFKYAE